ncbi:MAG: hypothetical protein IJS53_02420 [Clostridia bacterium]|nr:hypothetical protein [Clostridia bacterium]
MSKLFKYEFRKTLFAKLIVAGLAVVLEAAYLLGLALDKPGGDHELMTTSILLLIFLAFGSVLGMGLMSLVTLHRDMNTRQGYMLFMTPNSSYKMLGAKLLEAGLSILLAGAFFFALGALDIVLLFAHEQDLEELWNMISRLLEAFNSDIAVTLPNLICLAVLLLTGWIATLTAACLADVLMSSVLNGKKGSGILAFLVFIVIVRVVRIPQTIAANMMQLSLNTTIMLVQSVISLALSCGMYVLTAEIMQRKLSV